MNQYLLTRGPYLLFVLLFMAGTYMLIAHRNYLKKLTGLYLMQTAIILFFILLAMRHGGTLPIIDSQLGNAETTPMINPLPHALMLTAIVVGVATLGVALAILRRIQAEEGAIEEDREG